MDNFLKFHTKGKRDGSQIESFNLFVSSCFEIWTDHCEAESFVPVGRIALPEHVAGLCFMWWDNPSNSGYLSFEQVKFHGDEKLRSTVNLFAEKLNEAIKNHCESEAILRVLNQISTIWEDHIEYVTIKLEAVAPCQECGEEVTETEVCGDENDWFCPDCYQSPAVKVSLDLEDLGLPLNYFERLAEENHKLITAITQQGPGRALSHLGKVSNRQDRALACFRLCAEFVTIHPQPFAVEPYKGGRALFGAVLKSGVPTWSVMKAVN